MRTQGRYAQRTTGKWLRTDAKEPHHTCVMSSKSTIAARAGKLMRAEMMSFVVESEVACH